MPFYVNIDKLGPRELTALGKYKIKSHRVPFKAILMGAYDPLSCFCSLILLLLPDPTFSKMHLKSL